MKAIALLYGASVHIGNIFGLTGTAWLSTPVLWMISAVCPLASGFLREGKERNAWLTLPSTKSLRRA